MYILIHVVDTVMLVAANTKTNVWLSLQQEICHIWVPREFNEFSGQLICTNVCLLQISIFRKHFYEQ